MTNAEDIIEMLYSGYNRASSTRYSQDASLSQDQMVNHRPKFFPPDEEDKFFFKLRDWTQSKHARFTCGLISGAKKYVICISDKTTFSSIINDPSCIENKEFKMFSHTVSLSLIHTLAVDLNASLGKAFPAKPTIELDEEEVQHNFDNAKKKHQSIYIVKERNIREAHAIWFSDKEASSAKVKNALEIKKATAAAEDALMKLVSAFRSKEFTTKRDSISVFFLEIRGNPSKVQNC